MSEDQEFASTRYWKSPNTLDEEVPPAQGGDEEGNARRIREIVEAEPKPGEAVPAPEEAPSDEGRREEGG